MPHIHDGIGTWYYGKKNLQKRDGQCQFCHQNVTLNSYDTRLWFVIFMVPVIPLGKKHIIDDCIVRVVHFSTGYFLPKQ